MIVWTRDGQAPARVQTQCFLGDINQSPRPPVLCSLPPYAGLRRLGPAKLPGPSAARPAARSCARSRSLRLAKTEVRGIPLPPPARLARPRLLRGSPGRASCASRGARPPPHSSRVTSAPPVHSAYWLTCKWDETPSVLAPQY